MCASEFGKQILGVNSVKCKQQYFIIVENSYIVYRSVGQRLF